MRPLWTRGRRTAARRTKWFGNFGLLPSVFAMVAVAVVVAIGAFWIFGVLLLGASPFAHRADSSVHLQDVLKLALTVAAGLGGVVALTVAYRRQRAAESGRFGQRFADAAAQLGGVSAAVRIAGAYAMAALADESREEERRQQCVDVLCAYLRLPYHSGHGSELLEQVVTTDAKVTFGGQTHNDERTYRLQPMEREVRFTIVSIIRDHVQQDATVTWRGHRFDFSGATFDGGSFHDVQFSGIVDFSRAQFSGGLVDFSEAEFSGSVDFIGAQFSGGRVDFTATAFWGGTIGFRWAEFSGGTVDFSTSEFSGGTDVSFFGAKFSDGSVYFSSAQFLDCKTDFVGAEFSGGAVDFSYAEFRGGWVDFSLAKFSDGLVTFRGVEFFGGPVNFSDAVFSSGQVDFTGAQFPGGSGEFKIAIASSGSNGLGQIRMEKFSPGRVDFPQATFSGCWVDFAETLFNDCDVGFSRAKFAGGTVDLRRVHNWSRPPTDLPDAARGLGLPTVWAADWSSLPDLAV